MFNNDLFDFYFSRMAPCQYCAIIGQNIPTYVNRIYVILIGLYLERYSD